MDYALRHNGWVDEFRDNQNTCIYAAVVGAQLRGFSLLSPVGDKEAEFRIAIHPDWTGKGLGREVTLATLKNGFGQLGLEKIHLIVRKNNSRAAKLYENIGFAVTGQSVHEIQGKRIEFVDMSMTNQQFEGLN